MKTNNLGNVPVTNAGFKPCKFPLSKNFYGSCGFGEVCCYQCHQVDADTKNNFKVEALAYLNTLVAPTYGHVNLNFWHYFVEMSDLTEMWQYITSKTSVYSTFTRTKFYPKKLPYVPHNLLSTLFLWGAHMTVYTVADVGPSTYKVWYPSYKLNDENMSDYNYFNDRLSALKQRCSAFLATKVDTSDNNNQLRFSPLTENHVSPFDGVERLAIDARLLVDLPSFNADPDVRYNINTPMYIPLSNPNEASIWAVLNPDGTVITDADGIDVAPVDLQSADFVIERNFNGNRYIFAFRMHSFANRLYKIFKGMNFQEDFTVDSEESIMPFFAVYKSYFDSNGILEYDNWYNTPVATLLKNYDSVGGALPAFGWGFYSVYDEGLQLKVGDHIKWLIDNWTSFVLSLGSMWVTSSQDFVSAHSRSGTIAPTMSQDFVNRIALANGDNLNIAIPESNGDDPAEGNVHAYIDNVLHTHLSSQLLQKLALCTNRDTIAGKRLYDLIKMAGLGDWYDHMKPRFIGSDSISVDFSQVISQANTFKDGDGAILGERGGRGQAYGECKKHFYHNDNIGFLITLFAVVPDAGYCQGQNVAFDCTEREKFYLPDFDGLGFEATKVKQICGEQPIALLNLGGSRALTVTDKTFGFIPMMSKFKVNQNTVSGNFAKRSKRQSYLPYSLDKFIDLGEIDVYYTRNKTYNEEHKGLTQFFNQVFNPETLPLAGVAWRYPTRYPFLGHFTRIFANLGDSERVNTLAYTTDQLRNAWEFLNNEDDGFCILSSLDYVQKAPKLPITDSFQTRDSEDGNSGPISTNISKA